MASSRDKEPAPPHHHPPLLSSLVVRPSHTEAVAAGGGRVADFEPGELHRDPPPPYSRSDRYPDEPGLFHLSLISVTQLMRMIELSFINFSFRNIVLETGLAALSVLLLLNWFREKNCGYGAV